MNENLSQTYCRFWAPALSIALTACSSENAEPAPSGQAGSSTDGATASTMAGTGQSAGGQTTTSLGGSGNVGGSTSETSDGGSGTSGASGTEGGESGGSGGTDPIGFSNTGLCAFAGSGVWQDGSYSGTHDLILVGDQGVGEDLCVVRFDANTVSDPEVACTVISSGTQLDCLFGTVVELSNPTTITDVDGVCANSERALDEDEIAAWVGEQFGMGFAPESTGHGNILVRFDESTMTWTEWASATFDSDTGDLEYRQSDGVCEY